MAPSLSSTHRAIRRVAGSVAIVAAALVGLAGIASSADAWHPESDAGVVCTDERIELSWTASSYVQLYGPDFYNPDVRVYVQYGTDDAPIGELTDTQIGAGAFSAAGLTFSGTSTLEPPAGATRVRVHSEAPALWESGNATIPHVAQTTPWMVLPSQCVVEETTTTTGPEETTTTTAPEETTTTTVAEETTTTTVAEETTTTTAQVSDTTVTTAPPTTTSVPTRVLSGAAVATQGLSAQVVPAQQVATQSLPNTGSSTGVLLAGAVLLLSVGGSLLVGSRRLIPVEARTED
jgi:LPXTG-motif cell wall-anchored protein